jgi:hypothetical protein
VQGVEGADVERLGEVAGAVAGSRIELHDQHAGPVGAEHAAQSGALWTPGGGVPGCGAPPPTYAWPSPTTDQLRAAVRTPRSRPRRRSARVGARIDLQAHSPRSSASASSMRMLARAARRTRAGGATSPRGADIHPWPMPSSRRALPGNGARMAFGTPRCVTRMVSPRPTRARYRDSCCLSSRTPTSTWMQ